MRKKLLFYGLIMPWIFPIFIHYGKVGFGGWPATYSFYYVVFVIFTFLIAILSLIFYRKMINQLINDNCLWVGQSKSQVRKSWGDPDKIKSGSRDEIWYYGPLGMSGTRFRARITLRNGTVVKYSQDQKDF